jgi:hypothetical protein
MRVCVRVCACVYVCVWWWGVVPRLLSSVAGMDVCMCMRVYVRVCAWPVSV